MKKKRRERIRNRKDGDMLLMETQYGNKIRIVKGDITLHECTGYKEEDIFDNLGSITQYGFSLEDVEKINYTDLHDRLRKKMSKSDRK